MKFKILQNDASRKPSANMVNFFRFLLYREVLKF